MGTEPDFRHRLRAARITSGFLQAAEAVQTMRVPSATYRAAELGTRSPSEQLLDRASSSLVVSLEFLRSGQSRTEDDDRAQRIARLLADPRLDAWESDAGTARALRKLRIDAGFESGQDAAAANGWSTGTYIAHENGGRRIPVDRLIGYAIAFAGDVDDLFFRPLVEHSDTTSRRGRSQGNPDTNEGRSLPPKRPTRSREWGWLQTRRRSPGLPLLSVGENGVLAVSGFPFCAPLPFDCRPSDASSDSWFAVVIEGARSSIDIAIVDRYDGNTAGNVLAFDGRQIFKTSSSDERLVQEDPTKSAGSAAHPVMIGVLIGTLRLEWSGEASSSV